MRHLSLMICIFSICSITWATEATTATPAAPIASTTEETTGTSSIDLKMLGSMMGNDTDKATLEKMLNTECQKYFKSEMASAMKSAKQDDAALKIINDNAKKLCDCSAPKTLPLIAESLKKPEAEQGAYFDTESMKLGFECMK